ncbi:MAG: type II toxin-antitoxin system MqsA family antitoxin [Pseudomonadota bacterium]
MKCFACSKGTLEQKIKKQTYTYKGKSIELEQPGLWCDSCDEGILSGKDIAKTEKAFENFKSKVDGILLPEEIRYIRKEILKLTQEEAGKLFGGGKNGFSRYERGEVKPLPAISTLLKMFERHPEDVKFFLGEKKSA